MIMSFDFLTITNIFVFFVIFCEIKCESNFETDARDEQKSKT
jgi:hypothetical protein